MLVNVINKINLADLVKLEHNKNAIIKSNEK